MKNYPIAAQPKNEIVVYQPNETMRLEVMVNADTVWLNRRQIAQLFGRDVKTIGKHIANALREELAPVVAKFAATGVVAPIRSGFVGPRSKTPAAACSPSSRWLSNRISF